MLLFLDFDGVLHPVLGPREMHVCRLSVLESVLRQAPQVRIVISSTWRLFFGMSELRAVVSADIAARIVGATPPPDDEPRHAEIMRYLKQHATHATEWVAVDGYRTLLESNVTNSLTHYFDPTSGLFSVRVENLVKDDGELASLIQG